MSDRPKRQLKSPRKRRPKQVKQARYGASNYFARLAETEEGRAQLRAWAKARKPGRKPGVPDGYTAKTIAPLRAAAERDAERLIKIMEEQDILLPTDELLDNDAAMAKEALKETIIILRTPGDARNKLAAARTVLEYTRQKPAQNSNVTVSKAEDFLAALAEKEEQK
jgi:hypothetical protein